MPKKSRPKLRAVKDAAVKPRSAKVLIPIRLDREWVEEADELARMFSEPGAERTRTEILRVAIARGLAALRKEAKERGVQ